MRLDNPRCNEMFAMEWFLLYKVDAIQLHLFTWEGKGRITKKFLLRSEGSSAYIDLLAQRLVGSVGDNDGLSGLNVRTFSPL